MKIIKNTFLTFLALFILSCSKDDFSIELPQNPEQIQLEVIGSGTALGVTKTFTHPKTGEELKAECFLVDLLDSDTGEIIGAFQECIVENLIPSDGTITSQVISTINIHERGSIQYEGSIFHELQPPMQELNFNSSFVPVEDNVIHSTFKFLKMLGTVSVNGDVNYYKLGPGIIIFNYTLSVKLVNE